MEIQKHDTNFESIRFVIRAMDKEKLTKYNCIYVDDTKIETTNGHHLHRIENTIQLEPGFYTVTKNTKTKIILEKTDIRSRWPDTDRVFPRGECKEIDIVFSNGNESIPYTKFIRELSEERTINFDYFEALNDLDHYTAKIFDDNQAILFENNIAKALIMPMRI